MVIGKSSEWRSVELMQQKRRIQRVNAAAMLLLNTDPLVENPDSITATIYGI